MTSRAPFPLPWRIDVFPGHASARTDISTTSYHSHSNERQEASCEAVKRRQALTPRQPVPRLIYMDHLGGCHCGNIHVRLRLTRRPEDNPIRGCTCSFCRSHNPRMVSDPDGLFKFQAEDWSLVERYRFGTRTCDFLICRRCGVFIAAVAEMTAGVRAVVM